MPIATYFKPILPIFREFFQICLCFIYCTDLRLVQIRKLGSKTQPRTVTADDLAKWCVFVSLYKKRGCSGLWYIIICNLNWGWQKANIFTLIGQLPLVLWAFLSYRLYSHSTWIQFWIFLLLIISTSKTTVEQSQDDKK